MTLKHASALLASFLLLGASGGGCAKDSEAAAAWDGRDTVHAGMLSSGPVEDAESLLREALLSNIPLLRANAIEALQRSPEILRPALPTLLEDENRGVRFVAAMTVGQLEMTSVVPSVEPLMRDPNPSVQAAAIYALMRCGQRIDPTPLAGMLTSSNPEVKGNAAMIFGKLGNPSAIPLLRDALRWKLPKASIARQRIVELQVAEALVKLGALEEMDVIRAALFAPVDQGEITALAAQMCGRLGDEQYAATLQSIAVRTGEDREPAEVRLAAVWALGQLNPAAAPAHVAFEYARHEMPAIRAQATHTLGWLDAEHVDEALSRMIRDEDPLVQVAAAGAIVARHRR